MVKVEFFPIDLDYYDNSAHRPVIRIFGRTLDGKRVCVLDDSFNPYFYVAAKSKESIGKIISRAESIKINENGRIAHVIKTEIVKKNILNRETEVIKITVNNPKDVPLIKDEIKKMEDVEDKFEIDIPFYRRYLIDKNIIPLVACEVDGDEVNENLNVDTVIKAREIKQISDAIIKNPKVLAFDIEVYNERRYPNEEKDPIVMAAFYGNDGFSKVITWKKFSIPKKHIEFVDDEGELILRFKEIVNEFKPDYLVGYFSDGFDFPYLRARADRYRIRLDLGLDRSDVRFIRKGDSVSAKINGFCHLDIFKFIRRVMFNTLDVESFDLDNVAKAILGEGKENTKIEELYKAWNSDNEKLRDFCDYNLQDAKIALRLSSVMTPNLNELIKLIGLTVFDVSRMSYGQLVEWYLIKRSREFNQICLNRPSYDEIKKRRMMRYEGAFVYQPEPGLYRDIAVFDFRSLYPTVIIAHNICPSTLTSDEKNSYKTPEIVFGDKRINYFFDYRHDGFIPSILKDLIVRRNRIKEITKKEERDGKKIDPVLKARVESLKILLNSFYGYMGFPGARWYCMECAAATTAYGRDYIKNVMERAKKSGFKVLYIDTDSIFLALEKKTQKDAMDFLKEVNAELPSLMELELENFYPRGIFVMKKTGVRGAKKKYSLIDERGNIKVTGFETIRGDWSYIAKEAQSRVFEIILREEDKEKALQYVKDLIKKIKDREIPIEKMIIQKQLKKDIGEYAAIGPHVTVAKRMRELGMYVGSGTIVKYIVNEGKGIIRERAKLPEESKDYDYEYYINNQIIPAVIPILEVLGYSKETLLNTGQAKLGEF